MHPWRSGDHQIAQANGARVSQAGRRLATYLGWHYWHDVATNAPRKCRHCGKELHLPRNPAGFPDLLLIRRPRLIWAELKADRGVVTPDQRDMLEELRSCGQEVYLWRPSMWSELKRYLPREHVWRC